MEGDSTDRLAAPTNGGRSLPYAAAMAKQRKPGDSTTPAGSPEGPPGKKQKSKARKNRSKGRG